MTVPPAAQSGIITSDCQQLFGRTDWCSSRLGPQHPHSRCSLSAELSPAQLPLSPYRNGAGGGSFLKVWMNYLWKSLKFFQLYGSQGREKEHGSQPILLIWEPGVCAVGIGRKRLADNKQVYVNGSSVLRPCTVSTASSPLLPPGTLCPIWQVWDGLAMA